MKELMLNKEIYTNNAIENAVNSHKFLDVHKPKSKIMKYLLFGGVVLLGIAYALKTFIFDKMKQSDSSLKPLPKTFQTFAR